MSENTQKVSKKFLYLIIFSYAIQGLVENTFTSAWPSISNALNADISLIGVATMISYVGSSTTCILADRIRKKFGTNYSSILTLTFYIMSFIIMFLARSIFSVMLAVGMMGFGIGLNEINSDSYVIKAYDAKWDSFLHAFWGVGSFVAPVLLGLSLHFTLSYHFSLITVVIICLITILIYVSFKRSWLETRKTLPKEVLDLHSVTEEEKNFKIKFFDLLKIKKVIFAFICFFLLNGVVRTITAILATLLVGQKMLLPETATFVFSFYFIATYIGRIFFGFLSNVVKAKNIMKVSINLTALSLYLFRIADPNNYYYVAFSVAFIGFATSPLIPFMNYNLKEVFDIKYLSIVLGYGEIIGLIGTGIVSFLIGLAMKMHSIWISQTILIGLLIPLIIFYSLFIDNFNELQNSEDGE